MQFPKPPLDGGLFLDVVGDESGFLRLEKDWRELERRAPNSGVFQSFPWTRSLWRLERAQGVDLRIAAIRSEEGKLVAVLPLVLERRGRLLPLRVLRFLGQPFSDAHDLCLDKGADEVAVVELLGAWLASGSEHVDLVDLNELPSQSPLLRSRALLLEGFEPQSIRCIRARERRLIPLPHSFDDYVQGLDRQFRKNFRRRRRMLADRFDVAYQIEDGFGDPENAVGDLIRLHQGRMREMGQRGLFRSETRREALGAGFHALLAEGTLRIHRLLLDGRVVAADAVLSDGSLATCYIGGLESDPALARYSLGTLNLMEVIRWSIETGHTGCDLARGDEPYKQKFGAEALDTSRLLAMRGRVRAPLALASERAWRRFASSAALRSLVRGARRLAEHEGSDS